MTALNSSSSNLSENKPTSDVCSSDGLKKAHFKFIVSYDGTRYQGFQRQAPGIPTVQAELESALRRLGWREKAIRGAGRTDSGVSALAQAVSARLRWGHSLGSLVNALNAQLPTDIAVQSAERVRDDFDPRRDAVSRSYRYRVIMHPHRQPLAERSAWRTPVALDEAGLFEAGRVFLGTHDFAAFGSAPEKGGSTVRVVYRSRWTRVGSAAYQYDVEANGFLYRMVRRMVFLQVIHAQGLLSPGALADAVENQVPFKAGLAPAAGLTLVDVAYPRWITNLGETENSKCNRLDCLEMGE